MTGKRPTSATAGDRFQKISCYFFNSYSCIPDKHYKPICYKFSTFKQFKLTQRLGLPVQQHRDLVHTGVMLAGGHLGQ